MSANHNPIFVRQADNQWATLAAANTARDGTGNATVAFLADSEVGGYVHRMRFRALGTNVVTVARIFVNNGQDPEVAANNSLIDELLLAASTATEVDATIGPELGLGFALPPGHRLLVTLGTTVAAGYAVTTFGGKY